MLMSIAVFHGLYTQGGCTLSLSSEGWIHYETQLRRGQASRCNQSHSVARLAQAALSAQERGVARILQEAYGKTAHSL